MVEFILYVSDQNASTVFYQDILEQLMERILSGEFLRRKMA